MPPGHWSDSLDLTGWFAHFKYRAVLSSSQCFPVLVLTVRWIFVWCISGKYCQRAITLHLRNHQDLIAFPSKRRLSFLLPLNRWIILSQTRSWIQETQATLSTEHKQLREQPENFPTLRLSPSPLPLGGSLRNQDSNSVFWLSPFLLLHSVLTKHDRVPNAAQRLQRGDASGTDESRSCRSFPTGHLRGQRSAWATEPGQTTAAWYKHRYKPPASKQGESDSTEQSCGSAAADWQRSRLAASSSPKSGTCLPLLASSSAFQFVLQGA